MLGPLPHQPDWHELRATVLAWAEQGFHLVRTARTLHVHRNTLVYRLRKIERLLGRDLRDHRNALALHLACLVPEANSEPGKRS
ncbi:helix-turn-helix domain-containing protein [Pseudonocardia sp. H11422]|uniref:PucR family transcriptional regulator n=1 Tax=Pseudonocardia sp. H11422 TaxID=2835866 RepID=UPI001BDC0B6C